MPRCKKGTYSGKDNDLSSPALGNVLIVSEDLESSDPDDEGSRQVEFHFDFSTLGGGTVDVFSLTALDVEKKGTIELYRGSRLIKTLQIPRSANNGINVVTIREDRVNRMIVKLSGSGAIDNVRIRASDSE